MGTAWNKGFKTGKLSLEHRRKIQLALKLAYKTGKRTSTFEKGHTPWNKNTKGIMRANSGSFMKGHPAPKTAFKNGQFVNESTWNWKGNDVSYIALHSWVRRKLGNPIECKRCKKPKNRYEWANISRSYKREFE